MVDTFQLVRGLILVLFLDLLPGLFLQLGKDDLGSNDTPVFFFLRGWVEGLGTRLVATLMYFIIIPIENAAPSNTLSSVL